MLLNSGYGVKDKLLLIMIKENKDLLLKDLCSRLLYGVKCQIQEDQYTYIGTLCRIEVDDKNGHLLDFAESINGLDCQVYLSEAKPYLFPLSSMTEEQKKEYNSWRDFASTYHYEFGDIVEDTELYDNWESIDYLIANHFDYRGLIPMGLAIDATGLNIY